MNLRKLLVGVALLYGGFLAAGEKAGDNTVTLYKTPTCGCCALWGEALQRAGFKVKTIEKRNLYTLKKELKVPGHLSACHTSMIGGYVIEGHVPLSAISRLIKAKPKDIYGIAVGGMPRGSLGMEFGNRKDSYNVMGLKNNGKTFVFEAHKGT